jgi:hypothetical protein
MAKLDGDKKMHERIISTNGMAQSLRAAKATSTRLLRFPDGVTRHITLEGWRWAVFDRGDTPGSLIKSGDFLHLAFYSARDDQYYPEWSFETKLRHYLAAHLMVAVPENSESLRAPANRGS